MYISKQSAKNPPVKLPPIKPPLECAIELDCKKLSFLRLTSYAPI